MAKSGFPSMTALLGLLAVAGYQNRDKISEMLSNRGNSDGAAGSTGFPDILGGRSGNGSEKRSGLEGLLSGFLGGAGVDKMLGGGLSELTDRFRQNGREDTAQSWIGSGSNREVTPQDLEQVLDADTLDELTEKTGFSRSELLLRLSRELPRAVDQYTPDGRLPRQNA